MGQITKTDIDTLNTKIKNLFNERKNPIEGGINVTTGNGYKTAPVDFSPTPVVGEYIKADAYNKTFGALNKAGMIFDSTLTAVSAAAGTAVPKQTQYTNAINFVTTHSSDDVSTTTKEDSGCNAFCTGLCAGTCYTSAGYQGESYNSCYCQGCSNACDGCSNECIGNMSYSPGCSDCSSSCTDWCTGCGDGCRGCSGNCLSCYSSCGGCAGTCSGGCSTTCKNGCSNALTGG